MMILSTECLIWEPRPWQVYVPLWICCFTFHTLHSLNKYPVLYTDTDRRGRCGIPFLRIHFVDSSFIILTCASVRGCVTAPAHNHPAVSLCPNKLNRTYYDDSFPFGIGQQQTICIAAQCTWNLVVVPRADGGGNAADEYKRLWTQHRHTFEKRI